MNDFNQFFLPPKGVENLDPAQPRPNQAPKQEDAGVFQEQLRKALGSIQQDVNQVANSAPANLEDMQKAMEAAQNAYSGTMHAHDLMQSLLSGIQNDQAGESDEQKSESNE